MEKKTQSLSEYSLSFKIKMILKEIILTIIVGIITSVTSYVVLDASQWNWEYQKIIENMTSPNNDLMLLQIGIIFMIFIWIKTLTGTKWGSVGIVIMLSGSFGIANQQKLFIRGEPLYPTDLTMVNNIFDLIDMVEEVNIWKLFLGIIIVLVPVSFLVYIELKKKKMYFKNTKYLRIPLTIILSFALIELLNFNQPGSYYHKLFDPHTHWVNWGQTTNYQKNGFVTGFLYNLKSPAMNKPEDYTKDSIVKLMKKYDKKTDEINRLRNGTLEDINIIFVMNESFSDPYNLSNISVSEDPIPKFRKLQENNLSGSILSQGYGGGTANIEFEALTNISMEPLSYTITSPYNQLTKNMESIPNMVSYMKGYGHTATAIHPFGTGMYKRVDVYNNLGFDSFFHKYSMVNTTQHENNPYISDKAAYQEALDTMQKTSSSDFIHIVTMHNHTPYENLYDETSFTVEGVKNPEIVEHYYQGLSYSDSDLKFFIEKIESFSEKTMIVFWGDHLPGIYDSEIFSQIAHVDKYETPLLIYSNFETAEKKQVDIGLISPIYFINHVLSISNVPVDPFGALLIEMEEALPAFEKGKYITKEKVNVFRERDELPISTQELLRDYDLILFDILSGNQYSIEAGFFN